jgi:hypothetical protein
LCPLHHSDCGAVCHVTLANTLRVVSWTITLLHTLIGRAGSSLGSSKSQDSKFNNEHQTTFQFQILLIQHAATPHGCNKAPAASLTREESSPREGPTDAALPQLQGALWPEHAAATLLCISSLQDRRCCASLVLDAPEAAPLVATIRAAAVASSHMRCRSWRSCAITATWRRASAQRRCAVGSDDSPDAPD